jgi:hypothetical protein
MSRNTYLTLIDVATLLALLAFDLWGRTARFTTCATVFCRTDGTTFACNTLRSCSFTTRATFARLVFGAGRDCCLAAGGTGYATITGVAGARVASAVARHWIFDAE